MRMIIKTALSCVLTALVVNTGFSQCENWNSSPKKNDAENAHSVYRQALKQQDYDIAFENWQIAYDIAPAADGKRDYHYVDGAALYLHKYKNETDEDKKKEYRSKVIELWDQAIQCYEAGALNLASCEGVENCYDKKIGFIAGRKAYDMYYVLRAPYSSTLEALEMSMDKSGNDAEYIIFDPAANIIVHEFQKGSLDAAKARELHGKLYKIVDANIEKGGQYGEYFENAKTSMNIKFREIESEIFDCAYFKNKLEPEYRADPENPEVLKRVLSTLKSQGCEDTDALVMEIDVKWKKYAAEENARIQAEHEANNPSIAAKSLYDKGDYEGAIEKYDIAIAAEMDNDKKANYLFSKASIQFRKLKSYSAARATAREAAKLKPNWGRPYMLIGDMYGSTARSCGSDWNQRLAIMAAMDKYSYAKSIDPEVAAEATDRINKYYSSLPEAQAGFMRNIKAGDKEKVGCWIGETVSVRYK